MKTYLAYAKAEKLFQKLYNIAKKFAEEACASGKRLEDDPVVYENPAERLSDLELHGYVEFHFGPARVRIYPSGRMECTEEKM
jgi:hypothetical protein